MQKASNCPKCGKLFIRVRNICPECFQQQENEYLQVAAYLREHRGSTLQEVTEATQVSMNQIRNFILAGRIIVGDFPNLEYHCESCGAMIKRGKVCDDCSNTLQQLVEEADKRLGDSKLRDEKHYSGYKSRI